MAGSLNIDATGTFNFGTSPALSYLIAHDANNGHVASTFLQFSGTAPTTIEIGMKNGAGTFTPFQFADGSTTITSLPATVEIKAIPIEVEGVQIVVTGGSPDFWIDRINGYSSQK